MGSDNLLVFVPVCVPLYKILISFLQEQDTLPSALSPLSNFVALVKGFTKSIRARCIDSVPLSTICFNTNVLSTVDLSFQNTRASEFFYNLIFIFLA